MEIANELRQLRLAAGVSQEAVARRLGRSVGTVRNWECGTSEPRVSEWRELREWLKEQA